MRYFFVQYPCAGGSILCWIVLNPLTYEPRLFRYIIRPLAGYCNVSCCTGEHACPVELLCMTLKAIAHMQCTQRHACLGTYLHHAHHKAVSWTPVHCRAMALADSKIAYHTYMSLT